ncbi:MAG: hypothetical protein AB7I19_05460 [Planctomycetota bacterium]
MIAKLIRAVFVVAFVAWSLGPAQATLTVTTSGIVPRIPGTPFIPGCPTTLEPHYFAVSGTISVRPPATQEIRLLVKPRRLDGSTIPGCTWVSQCQRAFVLPDNSFVVIGQFGTDNVPRSWFSGQTADVQFALIDRNAGVGVCIANPVSVSIAVSNVTTVSIDPSLPSLHDFAGSCANLRMDTTGTPSLGGNLQFTLPSPGVVIFGPHDFNGLVVLGCRLYFSFPFEAFATDGAGQLPLTVPFNPALVGADFGTQGVLLVSGNLTATQPTLVSIR